MHKTTPPAALINRLVVIGLGLIGASFAKGVREAGLAREVVGVDLNARAGQRAVELGIVDSSTTVLAQACEQADVVMLAVPVLALQGLLAQLAALNLDKTIITDAGSVKGYVLDAAQQAYGYLPPFLVLGHPIAGSERSGVEA